MVEIKFMYKDERSKGKWNEQSCCCSSLANCIKWYGLDQSDVEYKIISIKNI